ncbi:MAG: hypothetical protein KA004_01635 [Verrucomicrobiales bacterium]|nr:hypothetical protein [Verrucomicrobiales bacterium]
MNDQPPPPPPPLPPAPPQNLYSAPGAGPQMPPELLVPKKSGWPTAIGVIGMVFGGAAALSSLVGLFTNSALSGMLEGFGVDKNFMDRHWAATTLLPILASALGVVLLVGGILLLMRRKAGVSVMLLWAVAKIAFVLVQAPLQMAMQKEMLPKMLEQQQKVVEAQSKKSGQTAPEINLSGFMDAAAGVGAVVGVVWGMALPVFLLIWFSRKGVRHDIASWNMTGAN